MIVLLFLANGFLASAELAIVTVRSGRIAQLAVEGNKRAQAVKKHLSDPHRFLATVQIGVTLVLGEGRPIRFLARIAGDGCFHPAPVEPDGTSSAGDHIFYRL